MDALVSPTGFAQLFFALGFSPAGILLAREAIVSGAARDKLEDFVRVTQRLGKTHE